MASWTEERRQHPRRRKDDVTIQIEGQYPPFENRNDDVVNAGEMRAFDTGATRNIEKDPDLYGFTSPLALGLFGEYMHRNRTQADGTVRDSDNWKKGIPLDSYMRSMRRHMQDLTLHHDGFPELAREDLEAAVCGLFFNVQGYMHEVVKQGLEEQRVGSPRREVPLNADGTPDAYDMFRVDEVMQIVGTVVGAVISDDAVFPTNIVLSALDTGMNAVRKARGVFNSEDPVEGLS